MFASFIQVRQLDRMIPTRRAHVTLLTSH